MRIAIGTPTHEVKEYGIWRWLDSVKAIDWEPMPLFISDNSNTPEFSERIGEYCYKIGLSASVDHRPDMKGMEAEARRVESREWIRNQILSTDADIWLSWECDIVVEPIALQALYVYLDVCDIVMHTYPDRDDPSMIVGGIGFALLKRNILERFSFLEGGGYAQCNPDRKNCYYSGDSWMLQRATSAGYKAVEFTQLFSIGHIAR